MMERASLSGAAQRLSRAYGVVALLLLNTLVLALLAELAAGLILAARPRPTLADEIAAFKAKMLAQEYYAGQDWARLYWDEHFQIVDAWQYTPYALWRTRPYTGTLIQVDEQGRRQTVNAMCSPDTYRIFTFGGSTMWGYGVPDAFTIASYVQQGLPGRNVCVVNYGEVGYNSTQGLITLLRLVQQGDRPDLAIFYDGSNDITLANRTGQAGAHFYLEQIAPALRGEAVRDSGVAAPAALRSLLGGTALYRLLVGEAPAPGPNWTQPPFDPAFLDAVTATYLVNIDTAAQLAAQHGFRFVAFLQPVLPVVARPYSDLEQRFIWETPGGLVDLFQAVYPRWQAAQRPYLVDLAHILDGATLPVWIDFNHLTAWGNLTAANDILNVIRPLVDDDLATDGD
ncbi:MAG: hypothetical protein MUE40_09475 [Anaerolineae bacterium]|nr:hypothetical protein [Anaerolineae bacterium]